MITCKDCGLPKDDSEFRAHSHQCRACKQAYDRARWEVRKAKYPRPQHHAPLDAAALLEVRATIAAQLGFDIPANCEWRPGGKYGPVRRCPVYEACKALPTWLPVACESPGDLPLVGLKPDMDYEAEYG